MMTQLGKRYAQALLQDRDICHIPQIVSDLVKFSQAYFKSPDLIAIVNSCAVPRVQLNRIITQVMQDLNLSEIVRNFIKTLIVNKRLNDLQIIIKQCHAYANQYCGIEEVILTSRDSIAQGELSSIQNKIQQKLNKKIIIDTRCDSSILGGFRLDYGSYRFDGTLNKQLSNLKNAVRKLSHVS